MFVDRVEIHCQAGNGGDGCIAFRREKYVPRGGPNGGDGGHGGSIIVRAERNLGSLTNIVGHRQWKAQHGEKGMGSLKTGASGVDAVILVPPGTLIKDIDSGEVLRDLERDGEEFVVARGGKGGRGNKRFATATNQTPRTAESGEPGEIREVLLELKLIADVGVIGMPNAGKSTLLSRLSAARPEIADYPFTTKFPNLGVVRVSDDFEFVMADIPGLSEGAHAGVGLGHEFLKHVQRTRVLVHLVEPAPVDGSDPIANYRQVREELRLYDPSLVDRPEVLAVSKCELPEARECVAQLATELGREVLQVSSATGTGLPELVRAVVASLRSM
ncbi:MAG: GTPase ObgE [Planctomycetaceae bacterium]